MYSTNSDSAPRKSSREFDDNSSTFNFEGFTKPKPVPKGDVPYTPYTPYNAYVPPNGPRSQYPHQPPSPLTYGRESMGPEPLPYPSFNISRSSSKRASPATIVADSYYPPTGKNYPLQDSYELDNFYTNTDRPLPSRPLPETPAPQTPAKGEAIINSNPMNPFESDMDDIPYRSSDRPDPFSDLNHASNDGDVNFPKDGFRENSSEFNRQRDNERQRRKLITRRPRFHYTKWPYFTMIVTIIQVCVFIAELAKMGILTGSPFQTQPYFNPMLGPSTYVLINMGARYVPCMQQYIGITDDATIQFPCANSTTADTNVCSLPQLCGMSSIPQEGNIYLPHQWYRIITPIFLHAGFLHILFNLLLQVTMGASIERSIGVLKYAIIYMSSGIAGFLLGANYTPAGIASTGASGSLFGIVATNIVMFMYCGKKNTNMYGTKRYGLFILIMCAEIVVSLVLGLLPGMDNFSHIGGFAMGVLMALILLPDPCITYIDSIIVYDGSASTWQQFLDNWNPKHNWNEKIHSRVYMWFAVRIAALALAGAFLGTLIKNFFRSTPSDNSSNCKWCKYINCIPVNGWCDIGNVSVSTTTSPSTSTASNESTPTSQNVVPVTVTTTKTPSSTPTAPNNVGNFRRQLENNVFLHQDIDASPLNNSSTVKIMESDNLLASQNVGAGFFLVIGLLTVQFFRHKKWI
ncbi:hypothetical protein CAAN1_06S05996 [[Candida] anglica]|uniref:Rhomboid-type serine protease n=1 Tax=[Candida] anglica TaxID=148631 RepID=A0ABP0EQ69_9ASCO